MYEYNNFFSKYLYIIKNFLMIFKTIRDFKILNISQYNFIARLKELEK